MPRSGDGVWTDIPNITAVPGQTIESADWNNYRADLRDNEFNAARPITAGGTGATNAADALANLGGVGQSNFLSAYSIGDFYETVRNIAAVDGVWLRRNGSLYDSATYPDLAALLPTLPDGVEWSNITSGTTDSIAAIIYDGTRFVYGSGTGGSTSKIYVSSDGQSWALTATISSFALEGLSYSGGIYSAVDVSGKITTSTDAVTWTTPVTVFTGSAASITYGNGLFVGVGETGQIRTSPDATTWTLRTSGTTENLWRVVYVNNLFVVVGGNGVVLSSANGTSWTLGSTGAGVNLFGIAYGAGLYVVVGAGGTIRTSPNLTSWTARTSGTSVTFFDVAYSSAGFLTVGGSGTARISSAGTTWTATATGSSSALRSITYRPAAPQEYFVSGASGTILKGIRTLPTQFRVPSDDPTYGWIKAEDA